MSATAFLVFHSESPSRVEEALENSSFGRLNLAKYHVYLNPFASMCADCSPVAVMSPHEGELSSECFRGCDRYFRRRHGHRSFVRRRLVGVVIHPKMHLHLGAESVVVALFEKAKAVEVLVAAADQPCEAVWTLKLAEVGGSVKAEPAVQAWWCIISWELLCCFNASVVLNQHQRWGFVVEDRQPCSMSQYPSATIDILCFQSSCLLGLLPLIAFVWRGIRKIVWPSVWPSRMWHVVWHPLFSVCLVYGTAQCLVMVCRFSYVREHARNALSELCRMRRNCWLSWTTYCRCSQWDHRVRLVDLLSLEEASVVDSCGGMVTLPEWFPKRWLPDNYHTSWSKCWFWKLIVFVQSRMAYKQICQCSTSLWKQKCIVLEWKVLVFAQPRIAYNQKGNLQENMFAVRPN